MLVMNGNTNEHQVKTKDNTNKQTIQKQNKSQTVMVTHYAD